MLIKIIKKLTGGRRGWFSDELDNYLKAKSASGASYMRKHTIRPSEIGQCSRKIVKLILNLVKEDPVDAKMQRIFDMGNWIHKRYLKAYIPSIGCVKMQEIEIDGQKVVKPFIELSIEDPELWIKGAPDAVIINKLDNLEYVFELKSIKQELFRELFAPLEDHILQVHLYMHMTGIPRAIVFYENKNDQSTMEFLVERDEKKMQEVLDKVRLIQKYVIEYPTTGALPEKCGSKHCIGCKD